MKRFFSKKFIKGLKIFLVIYILVGAALYFFQEKLLFHPEKLPANYRFEFSKPFKQVDVPLDNETILSIIQFTVPDSLNKGVVLYFHGNKGNIIVMRHLPIISPAINTKSGCSIILALEKQQAKCLKNACIQMR